MRFAMVGLDPIPRLTALVSEVALPLAPRLGFQSTVPPKSEPLMKNAARFVSLSTRTATCVQVPAVTAAAVVKSKLSLAGSFIRRRRPPPAARSRNHPTPLPVASHLPMRCWAAVTAVGRIHPEIVKLAAPTSREALLLTVKLE